jgi:hypothetical protein
MAGEIPMREPSWLRKHLVLAVLTLGCVLIDAGFLLALGGVLKWLAEMTSPFVLAGLAAIIIVTARVFWDLRLWASPVS